MRIRRELLLCLVLVSAVVPPAWPQMLAGKVIDVPSGRSLKIDSGAQVRVIDLLAVLEPTTEPGLSNARKLLSRIAAGKTVTIKPDADPGTGEVFLADGQSLNVQMIRLGFGTFGKTCIGLKYADLNKRLSEAQMEAQSQKRGVWGDASLPPAATPRQIQIRRRTDYQTSEEKERDRLETWQLQQELGADLSSASDLPDAPDEETDNLPDQPLVQRLDEGEQPMATTNTVLAPLLKAAKNGEIEEVRKLIDEGSSVQERGPGGETALHWAAGYGHKEIVDLLISKGADVNTTDTTGMTPLHMAAQEGQTEVARFLLAKKADPNADNADDMTPLHLAAASGRSDLVRLLLASGAPVDLQDNTGSTPLHLAAAYGHGEVVTLLLAEGAKISISDNDGNSPEDLANANDHIDIAQILGTHKAK